MLTRTIAMALGMGCLLNTPALASDHLETKWIRDSAEYWTITRQTYRIALQSVQEAQIKQKRWAVVLDVDETVLDNSPYQLERASYGDSFAMESWSAWCERRVATPVPGVVEFISAIRKLGGRVVYLSNRSVNNQQATIDNLDQLGLWDAKRDTICLQSDDEAYTKAARRAELRSGKGPCSVDEKPISVLGWFGDNIHDFPEEGEEEMTGGRDAQFGTRFFLFPNPMYGSWTRKTTRPLDAAE